jgi:hypothetical protein
LCVAVIPAKAATHFVAITTSAAAHFRRHRNELRDHFAVIAACSADPFRRHRNESGIHFSIIATNSGTHFSVIPAKAGIHFAFVLSQHSKTASRAVATHIRRNVHHGPP